LSGTGDTITYKWDGYGRVRSITDSEGYVVTFDYDALDRVTQITYPNGDTEQFSYTTPGAGSTNRLAPVASKDRQGRWTTRVYNSLQELVAITDPLGRTTGFEWCRCGGLQKIIDAAGRVTKWKYDIQGRATEKEYPDGKKITYGYGVNSGWLTSVTDPKSQTVAYEYHKDGRLKKADYPSGTADVTFNYDDTWFPRLTSMVDGTGTTNYAYVPYTSDTTYGDGRLASIDGPLGSDTIEYRYDKLGRIDRRTINGALNQVDWTFDAAGRVTQIVNNLGTFDYTYVNATSRLDKIDLPNNVDTEFDWWPNTPASGGNGDQRLKEIKHQHVSGSTTPISKFNYDYNKVGQITKWTQQTGTADPLAYDFKYDQADQLIEATLKNTVTFAIVQQYVYGYDKAGNRSSEQIGLAVKNATLNSNNQIASVTNAGATRIAGTTNEASTVRVRANGGSWSNATMLNATEFQGSASLNSGSNTIDVEATDYATPTPNVRTNTYSVTLASGATKTLTYDDNGNLYKDDNATSSDASDDRYYIWDAADRLVKILYTCSDPATDTGDRTEFTYDGAGRKVKIEEFIGGSSTTVKRHLWCGLEICEERASDGTTVRKRFFPQGVEAGSTDRYYSRDHLGSIRELTDNTGAVNARYDYDPYGRVTTEIPKNGLKVWLKADSLAQASGSAVSQWSDESGNANHATQGTSGNQPVFQTGNLNGKPAVNFDGSNDYLQLPNGFNDFSSGATLVVVAKPTAGGVSPRLIDLGSGTGGNNNILLHRYQDGKIRFQLTPSGTVDTATGTFPLNESRLITATHDGTNSQSGNAKIYKDGSLSVSGSLPSIANSTRTANTIGKSNWAGEDQFQGDIAEILIYNRQLTTIEREQLEAHLAEKYQLAAPSTLPSSDFRFTGHFYHARSALHLAPFRAYDADLGRWISRDPIAEDGGINLYGYCSDPVNYVDLDGLDPSVAPPTGPPPLPVPGAGTENYWVKDTNAGGSREVWRPIHPIVGEEGRGQPSASWDPEGHWDVDDGRGNRQRYDWRGNKISAEQAHSKNKPPMLRNNPKPKRVPCPPSGVRGFFRGFFFLPSINEGILNEWLDTDGDGIGDIPLA
jgi:RHS repeat-associated protein